MMDKDKSFERQYSINVARLKTGEHTDKFFIGPDFFEYFEHELIREASIEAELKIRKNESHLDVTFILSGDIGLPCDRCGEIYTHKTETSHRVFYAFDEDFKVEDHFDVMYVNRNEAYLSLIQELYDFINLGIPLRRVPEPEIHLCASETLRLLGLDAEGNPIADLEEEDKEIDPRWEGLKKLKDQMEQGSQQ